MDLLGYGLSFNELGCSCEVVGMTGCRRVQASGYQLYCPGWKCLDSWIASLCPR
ncbi:hypothetical protein ACP70R_046556 [Stipagrostis hirtigluma subsp. patula]